MLISQKRSGLIYPAPKQHFHFHNFFCFSKKESIPFAVIGSNTVVEAKGKRVRGRLYPWGIVEGRVAPLRSWTLSCVWCQSICCWVAARAVLHSGELGTLRFCEAEEHAHSHAHARPEGCDPGDPLRELQSSLHPEHDPHGGEGAQPQVCLHKHSRTYRRMNQSEPKYKAVSDCKDSLSAVGLNIASNVYWVDSKLPYHSAVS